MIYLQALDSAVCSKRARWFSCLMGGSCNWVCFRLKLFFSPPCLLSICRWVWRGVQRPPEAYWEKGNPRGHQDLEGWLLGEAEERLPVRGFDHGPVWPAEHHQTGGCGHQEQTHNDHHRVHGEWSARFVSQGKQNTSLSFFLALQVATFRTYWFKYKTLA